MTTAGYYEFVREERLFCAMVAHLLMQKGPNLETFLDLCDAKLGAASSGTATDLDQAEVYLEYSFLRDRWDGLGKDNEAKRDLVGSLLAKVEQLRGYAVEDFPSVLPEFNEFFMGLPGRRIRSDIAFPGHWSVVALAERFGAKPDEFRSFCMFKWSFNIKPDLVVLVPGRPTLCIEAKLESKEGQYPTRRAECERFDRIFGPEDGRVGQLELQRFMFSVLLDSPCEPLVLGRTPESGADLTWQEVFGKLEMGSSIGFVERLVGKNRHLTATSR